MKCVICGEDIPEERKARRPLAKTCSLDCAKEKHRRLVRKWQRANKDKVKKANKRWQEKNPERRKEYLKKSQAKYYAKPEIRFKIIYGETKRKERLNALIPTLLQPHKGAIFKEFKATWIKLRMKGVTMPHLLYAVCLHYVRKHELDNLFPNSNSAMGLVREFKGKRGKSHSTGKKIYQTLCQELPEYAEVREKYYRKKGIIWTKEGILNDGVTNWAGETPTTT